MKTGSRWLNFSIVLMFSPLAAAQTPAAEKHEIALTVPAGTPLRLYTTKRFSKRAGEPVAAKLLEPVYAFDREVLPAGTVVTGQVARTVPMSAWQRARAILGGDFTPLRTSEVEFTSLSLPDGRTLSTHTKETAGLSTMYVEPKPKKKSRTAGAASPATPNGGILGAGKQALKDRLNAQLNSRSQGMADIVRSPNKKERLYEFAMSKLPYHPQYVRRGTRFDAELSHPVSFGEESVAQDAVASLGTQPPPDSVVRARLLTAIDSGTAKQGDPISAVLAQPVYSPEHKLLLPEGTTLTGAVVMTKKARFFHRPGQLRFTFQKIELPAEVAGLHIATPQPGVTAPQTGLIEPLHMRPLSTQAQLQDGETGGKTPVQVDSEGGVKAAESKTRFLAPLASVIIAHRAADNDGGHAGGGGSNVSGRSLGGVSGFGLLGVAASQTSKYTGMAFGYYGMAWSVFSNVIARGAEVQFGKNAMIDIRFGARTGKSQPAH